MAGSSYLHIKGLLSEDELKTIDRLLEQTSFEDGKSTATGAAEKTKNNLQLAENYQKLQISQVVSQAISRNRQIQSGIMPKAILPPLVSKYQPGMKYGLHVDSPLMGTQFSIRTDVGMTLFLSDPDTYEGGALEVVTPIGKQSFKLPKGDAICYPTTQLHEVEPVTSGERLVAVTWMQCAVRDAHQREVIYQTLQVANGLEKKGLANTEEHLAIQQVYSNLVRMWAEL